MSTITVRECLETILGKDWESDYPGLHWATLTARTLVNIEAKKRELTPIEKTFAAFYDDYYGSMENGMVEAATESTDRATAPSSEEKSS